MKRNFVSSFILLLFFALRLNAANVTIIVTSIPANTPQGDNIYIAGNFNGWNPGNPDFILTANALSQLQIVLEGTGNLEFKFTRGSWETVEGGENGGFLPNRTFTFGTADTLLLSILSWEDTGCRPASQTELRNRSNDCPKNIYHPNSHTKPTDHLGNES
jgi:hypothetical protein